MNGEATQPRPNLAAVAALAGVSPSTASLAFSGAGPVSEATKARVLKAAAELNYAGPDPLAQSLRRGRSGIIGVILEDRLRDAFRDPVTVQMLDGVADELGAAGFGLLLLTETGPAATNIAVAPMDGVVLFGCSSRLDSTVVTMRQRGLPIVAIEADPMPDVLAIDLDNRAATARGARHLRDLGHERVAVVTLPIDAQHSVGWLTPDRESASSAHTASQRLRGLRDIYPDAEAFSAGGSLIEEGELAGLALLNRAERPTAIIAQSDLLAVGVFRAAQHLNISVPEELSILGFDGARIDGLAPHTLTTIVQDALAKGHAAGRAVIALARGEVAEPATFTSELRIGTTTGPVEDPLRRQRRET